MNGSKKKIKNYKIAIGPDVLFQGFGSKSLTLRTSAAKREEAGIKAKQILRKTCSAQMSYPKTANRFKRDIILSHHMPYKKLGWIFFFLSYAFLRNRDMKSVPVTNI